MSQVVLTAVCTLFNICQQFPNLAAALQPQVAAQADQLITWLTVEKNTGRWQREWHAKQAAFALYDCSPLISWGWWSLSLPARTIIHKTESRRRRLWT